MLNNGGLFHVGILDDKVFLLASGSLFGGLHVQVLLGLESCLAGKLRRKVSLGRSGSFVVHGRRNVNFLFITELLVEINLLLDLLGFRLHGGRFLLDGSTGSVSIELEADDTFLKVCCDSLVNGRDAMLLLVAPSRRLGIAVGSIRSVNSVVELELIVDERIGAQILGEADSVLDVDLEVKILLADQLLAVVDHEILVKLLFISDTFCSTRSVTDGQLTLAAACAINRQNGGIDEVLELETERLELNERLADKNRVWRIPERISLVDNLRKVAGIEVIVEHVTNEENTVLELVSRPIIEVASLLVVNSDHDTGLGLGGTSLKERINLLVDLRRERNLSAELLSCKVGLVDHGQELVETALDSGQLSLDHLLSDASGEHILLLLFGFVRHIVLGIFEFFFESFLFLFKSLLFLISAGFANFLLKSLKLSHSRFVSLAQLGILLIEQLLHLLELLLLDGLE